MKRGPKPRLITEEFLAKVEHLAARGLSQQQVCHALGFRPCKPLQMLVGRLGLEPRAT